MKHHAIERFLPAALVALAGIVLNSCKNTTVQDVGEAAAKPFVKAGEVAVNSTKKVGEMAAKPLKKANPKNWFNKDEEPQNPANLAEGVEAVTPGAEPTPAPDITPPSRNTVTPGVQPNPGVASKPRESLTLPSNPTAVTPTNPAPTPPPSLEPLPDLPADPPSLLEQPVTPSVSDDGPLSTPPTLETDDDGFLPLSPKLPEEEDVLPPE